MRYGLTRLWPLLLLLVLQLLFLFFPVLDLYASAWVYDFPDGFWLAGGWLDSFVEGVFGKLHIVLLLVLPWLMLASLYWGGAAEAPLRRKLYFAWLVLALAPGIAVEVLQDESGRAHPIDLMAFGGGQQMTAAFEPADQCGGSCAFVSRTAAVGFTLITLAWLLGDRAWIRKGILVGALIGLVGVLSGRSFVSDILFAFWPVYGACLLAAWLFLRNSDRRA